MLVVERYREGEKCSIEVLFDIQEQVTYLGAGDCDVLTPLGRGGSLVGSIFLFFFFGGRWSAPSGGAAA